ncbi:response regulator [Cognatiyoonia sp.]|uniref:response regulator n=1 Tax=Cognatiyoonia sp. TaxID=2211652 RepID=UPI003F696A2E
MQAMLPKMRLNRMAVNIVNYSLSFTVNSQRVPVGWASKNSKLEAKGQAAVRTLIVHSNRELFRLWQSHLERLGSHVSVSLDGHDAIEMLEVADFDVIVLDLMLSEENALSVADMASFRQPNANVVFVTKASFFSDGTILAHSSNVRAIVESETPPGDLAQIV